MCQQITFLSLAEYNHISSNITGFFEDYNKQIDYVIKNNVAATPEIATRWDNLINNKKSGAAERTTDVSPMLTTTWDQAPYYNADCPYDASGGGTSVTGCVATATAQVMKFWNWPTTGVGTHLYSTSSYGTLSADFGSTTYSWASMPNSISSPNAAIARLMSDVGISVNMDYSATESSSYAISSATGTPPFCAEYSLKTFFNYDPALHGEQRADYDDVSWINMLESDLNAGYPVIYTGTGTAGGHCFVFDGYETSGSLFHVNWGWSGMDDGYFTIDALNPASLGTGGGAGGFNSDQQAIFGIKPAGGGTTPTASLELYDYVNLTASTIGYGAAFTASTNIENTGTTTFTGDFCAIAFDASGSFISYVDSVIGTTLPAGDVFTSDLSFPTTGLLAMFPGTYSIGIFYRPTGGGWMAVANSSSGFYTNFAPITVVNSDPIELYAAMTPTPTTFVQGSPASVTLNLFNNGTYLFSGGTTYDFTGSFEVLLLNLDGSYNSTIQTMTGMSLPAFSSYTSLLTFSTTSITATPGSYYLTTAYNDGSGAGWFYAGADYYQNPVYINVVAPPPSPDMYEVNNTVGEAYDLTSTLSWVSNVAHTGTLGSNFHVVTDQDYYKLVLPSGYRYAITAAVDDIIHPAGGSYTVDAVWSYSTDGGTTWSSVYDDVMTGTPSTINMGGGTVIFHVSPHFAGNIGTYLLNISNITRVSTVSIPEVSLETARIFPNPASDQITVDLSGTGAKGIEAVLFDMQGKKVYAADVSNQPVFTIPVNSLAAGMYFVQVSTDAGMINKKITVSSK